MRRVTTDHHAPRIATLTYLAAFAGVIVLLLLALLLQLF